MTLVQNVQQRFNTFVDGYLEKGGDCYKDQVAYNKKRNHTERVFNISKEMLRYTNNFDEDEMDIILISSILHDIGCFEQWRRVKSFKDTKDFSHAEVGAEMLEDGFIQKFIPETREYDRSIIKVVRHHHNLRFARLSEKDAQICKFVGDADKIDIVNQFSSTNFNELYSQRWGDNRVSINVKKKFEAGQLIKINDVKNKADMLAFRLGKFKQISTYAGKNYVYDRNYVNFIVDYFKQRFPYYNLIEIEWMRNSTLDYLMQD